MSGSRKLLYLTPGVFDKGGISRYSRYQVSAFRELLGERQVRVLSMLGPGEDDLESAFSVDWFAGGTAAGAKARFAVRALGSVLRERPNIVWAAHLNYAGLAVLLARIARAEMVLNVYGLEVWSPMRADARWGFTRAPHLVSDCHYTATYIRDRGLWRGSDIAVAWDCVDTERFSPASPNPQVLRQYHIDPNDSRIRVLMLGRMSQADVYKGWLRILDVAERCRDAGVTFVLAGRGDYRQALEAEVASRDLGASVTFTGSIHENHLIDIYRCCDIFYLVSDRGTGRGEGIPLTPLEAAACGKPIIVGNQDGSQEAVVDGRNGFIVDSLDVTMHEQRIRRLVCDPDLRARMSENARQRIVQEHAYPVFRDRLGEILASIARP